MLRSLICLLLDEKRNCSYRKRLLWNLLWEERVVRPPAPRLREKKICEAADIQTVGSDSLLKSGLTKNMIPSTAPSSRLPLIKMTSNKGRRETSPWSTLPKQPLIYTLKWASQTRKVGTFPEDLIPLKRQKKVTIQVKSSDRAKSHFGQLKSHFVSLVANIQFFLNPHEYVVTQVVCSHDINMIRIEMTYKYWSPGSERIWVS